MQLSKRNTSRRYLALLALPLAACSAEDSGQTGDALSDYETYVANGGLAEIEEVSNEISTLDGPVKSAFLVNPRGALQEYFYQESDGLAVSGDMILGTIEEVENPEKGVVLTGKQWPNGTVYYAWHSSLKDNKTNGTGGTTGDDAATIAEVTQAMNDWKKTIGIRFVERTNQAGYVLIKESADYCRAAVGYKGNAQNMELRPGCTTGNIRHELGHALGLEHEQSRCNRDEKLNVFYDNIVDGEDNINFKVYCSDHDDLYTYDRGSIMQYGSFVGEGMAIDPSKRVLEWKADKSVINSQRTAPSLIDVKTLRTFYSNHKFESPRAIASGIATPIRQFTTSTAKDQFCKDQGYTSAETIADDAMTVAGNTWHAVWNAATGVWDRKTIAANLNIGIFKSITCKP